MNYWTELVYLISNTDHRCLVFGLNNSRSKYSCLFDLKYLVHGMDDNRREKCSMLFYFLLPAFWSLSILAKREAKFCSAAAMLAGSFSLVAFSKDKLFPSWAASCP